MNEIKKSTHSYRRDHSHSLCFYRSRIDIRVRHGQHLQLLRLYKTFSSSLNTHADPEHTFGTAAWKLSPVAGLVPDTWKRASIMTVPGCAADVWGVNVILSSFVSYAVYEVRRGAAGCGAGTGGDWVAGMLKADIGFDGGMAAAGGADAALGPGPNRPMISSTVDRGACAGTVAAGWSDPPPKMSRMRSSLF